MNFLKKLFKKEDTKESSSDIVEAFIEKYVQSEDVLILTESMLDHDKEIIKDAFDKRIGYHEFFLKRSNIGGVIGKGIKKDYENMKAMKVHVDDFVKIPPSLENKVEKANRIFEVEFKKHDKRLEAIMNLPEWVQKLHLDVTRNIFEM